MKFSPAMLLVMTVILLNNINTTMASCPEKEGPSFCDGGSYIQQAYCHGAEDADARWSCTKKNRIRCACVDPFFRRADGKCVTERECDIVQQPVDHTPEEPNTKRPELPYEVPEELQGSEQYLHDVIKFVQYNGSIVLSEIADETWRHSVCICISSTLKEIKDHGAERNLFCYKNLTTLYLPTSKAKAPPYRIHPVPSEADFEVTQKGWTYVALTNEKIDTNRGRQELYNKYHVAAYGEDCLLLSYGSWRDGMPKCMMFVKMDHDGGISGKGSACSTTKTTFCRPGMMTIWRDDCKDAYIREKEMDELAEKDRKAKATKTAVVRSS